MALKEFSGELDTTPQFKEFSGELDKPEPTFKDRIYKVANSLFGRGSVMDGFDPTKAVSDNPIMADVAEQSASRVIANNAAAKAPSLTSSDTKIVSGIPGILEVGARKGYAGIGRIEAGTIKALGDLFNSETLTDIADGQSRYADQVENGAILRKDPIAGFSGDSIVQELPQASANAIGSVIQTAPTLAAGAINPAAALPILFGTTAMQEYGEGRQAGLNPVGAGVRAVPMAALEVVGEKLGGFDKIAKGLNAATRGNGVANLGSAMASSAIREIPGEEVTTTGQFLTDKLPGVGLNQEATLDDFKKAVKDTALATMLQSGAMGVGGKILQGAAGTMPAAPVAAPTATPANPEPAKPASDKVIADVANLARMIEQTATQDSKLKTATAPKLVEAPDDIQLDQAPSIDPAAPEVNPLAPSIDQGKILQNRNRATPSSIAQMTSIAANPDYNRLSFSRDFANGAPVVSGGLIPDTQLGVSDIAVASDGRRIPIQYAVVDASELLPSNTADGSVNTAYDDSEIDAIRAIAGNGRVAGLQEAYNKDTAGTYRDELAADTLHGVDPQVIAGMSNPVLVRVMPQEHVTSDIGDVSNTVGNLELSPVEQANNDVQRVNLEALEFADDGSVTAKAIRQFVQAMPQAEQGSLLDTNGQPTKQAADRLNAAIFAKAYANDKLIRLYAQAQDPEARIVLSALAQVAPKLARLEGAGALDIRQAITDAAEIAVTARRTGLSITRAAQQIDITADANAVDVLNLFAANTRSSKAIAEALGRAADFAYSEAIKPEEGLFGIEPKASRQEVFDQLRNPNEAASQENMELAQGGKPIPQDAQRGSDQRPGQADAQGAETGRAADDTSVRQQPAAYGTDGTDYGLDSYTNQDIIERLDRIEKAQKEAAERARAEEAKRQADLERDQFGLTGSESPVDRLEAQGQGRLFQPTAEYETDPTIKADVERAYGGRAAYEAALASGKTTLSYDQWLRVRLPAFKRAFGNWEAVHAQNKLDAMQPVAVRVPDAWRGLSHIELRNKMAESLNAMVRDKVSVNNSEIGDIRISRSGAKKSEQTARDPAKSLVVADIKSVLPASIYARSDPSRGSDEKYVDGYSTMLAKVSVDGVPLIAVFTVRKQTDGNWYYNAVTLHDAKGKAQDSYGRPDAQKAGSSNAPIAGLSEFIRRPLIRVNPESLKGAINPQTGEPSNPEAFTIPANEYTDTYARQRDLFLDYGSDESQAGAEGEAAQRDAVSAMDDLRSSSSVLGRSLSSDYAASQRVTLVGQRVESAEDLATLAQVYRDPRFETFRLVFVNDAGRVVSQLGLTSRLPTSTQAVIGDDVDAYMKEVSKVARERGATRFWMLHNHPSGIARPSSADLNITRYFTEAMPALSNQGHVVIDTNEYAFIDPFATGEYDVRAKDFGAIEPMTAGEFSTLKITSPDQLMSLAKKLDVDIGAVTLVSVDAQSRVRRITSVPASTFTDDKAANHRVLLKESLSNNTFRTFLIGRDAKVLKQAGWHATDAILIKKDGSVETLGTNPYVAPSLGNAEIYPESRRTRVSPDTSPEFDYLRGAHKATLKMIARQSAWHGSPYTHDGFDSKHIGSGEGAQAFGWGHYFASMRAVAEWYRDNLSSRKGADPTQEKFSGKTFMEWYAHWENMANNSNNPTEFYDRMSMLENAELTWNPRAALNEAREEGANKAALKWFKETIADKFERPGSTYEVNIPEDADMLLFDKPITGQPDNVKKILKESGLWKELRDNLSDFSTPVNTRGKLKGENIYNYIAWKLGSEEAASKRLNELGIPGLKYKAGTLSDIKSTGYNYVIFDDKAIEILNVSEPVQKYGSGTTTDIAGIAGEDGTARSTAAPAMVARESGIGYNENPQDPMSIPPAGHKFDPIRMADFWSTVKSDTGRRQYAAGRKLWDRLDAYAGEYLGKLKLADTKPGAFKEMMRQFNVDKTKASQQAKRIAETGMSLTAEQRELLSDMIEKQAKVGDMAPEEMTGLASTMVAALDVQARELVDLGMLSEDRLVKNYLPRLYKSGLSGMLTNPTLMRSWFTKARMRIRGDRLHSRGMFAEIESGKVEQAKRLGWKVSSMPGGDPVPGDLLSAIDSGSEIPGQYRDAKVLMWRDYTESERQQMGEVRDGVLRYALGYVETQKDIAIGRLFKAIASNPELAKAHNPGGWVKVPDQEVSGAPGTKAYGALSGMWVEPQVADSLKRNTQPKGVLMAAYDRALSFWKEGKTVWNPVSHGNNVVSNLFTIYFAGLNPANPKPWRETLREYRTKGEYYTEALDNGLFGNEWANKEIQDLLMPDFADMADMESVAASRVAKMVEFAKKTGKPVSWYRENMQKAYEFEDQFFKLMLYIDRRKAGMTPQAAITDAERYVFNYADMPEGVERIKRFYSPFFAYTYKAIPMVLHTAMTRPDRMLAPIMLLGGANWLAYMFLGADEEEERKAMPEFMAGRTAIGTQKAVRLPFNIGDQPAFLDMSRRVPLGDLFDINNQTGGMPVLAPFMPSHPVLTILQAVIFNQDTFTGKKLVKDSDTAWEAAQTRAGFVAKQITPNAPFVPGSFNFNKLMDATAYTFDTEIGPYTGYTKSGDPVRPATVIPDVLTGTKIRSFDVDKNMAYKNTDLDKEAAEIRANIKAANKNRSMSESFRERYIESQQEKLNRIGEKRMEINQ